MQVQSFPVESLIPYQRNAKTHPKEQVEKIAQQISKVGFLVPIVVDRDMVVVSGHGRLLAAKSLGMQEVPVVVADLSEDQAMAWRIADNRVAESPWDMQLLGFDLQSLKLHDFDLSLTGFADAEAERLIQNFSGTDPKPGEIVGSPEGEWKGMPEFDQQDKTSFRHVVVHFRDEAAAAEFFATIGQNDTGQTRSIWFPPQENMDTESKRYGVNGD